MVIIYALILYFLVYMTILVISAVVISVVVIFVTIATLCFCYYHRRHHKRHHKSHLHQVTPTSSNERTNNLEEGEGGSVEAVFSVQLLQVIGYGKFGSVWKATCNDKVVAVRVFIPRHKHVWENEQRIYSLKSTAHENVLHFIGCEKQGNDGFNARMSTITEYHPLGSLNQFLKHRTLDMSQALNVMKSITAGLAHLHSSSYYNRDGFVAGKHAVVHRDIKSHNVLVKYETGQCVISDLGLALVLDSSVDDRYLAKSGQVGITLY